MIKNFRLLPALCAVIVAGSYTSCNKMEKGKNQTNTTSAKMTAISGKFNFKDFPEVEKGMLKFRDDDQYISYLQFLDDNIEAIDSFDTVNDEHTVLQEIEDGLEFTSLRSSTHADFIRQNDGDGFATIEEACVEHYVEAADIRSTLNADANVMIGDAVLHYISKDYAVRVEAGNGKLLQSYMGLSSHVSLNDIMAVDPEKYGSVIYELSGDSRIFGKDKFGNPTPLGFDVIQMPQYYFPDRCNNPKLVTFYELAYIQGGAGNVKGYFKVNYGDGSAIEDKVSSYDQGHWRVNAFSHTYPNIGTYTMTITGSPNSNFMPSITTSMIVNVAGGAPNCARAYKESGWQYLSLGSNRFIGGKLVMQDIGSSNNKRLRVVAYSKLVKQTGENTYKSFKGQMYIFLQGDAKEGDNCTFFQHVEGSGWDSNDNNQTLHRTPNYDATWTEFTSDHMYIGSDGGKYTYCIASL